MKTTQPFRQPSPRECSLLLMHLLKLKERETDKEISRARFSDLTLRRLFCRGMITPKFLGDLNEYLFVGGWALFFAGRSYAVVRTKAVNGWMRISSKLLKDDIRSVSRGSFSFERLENYLLVDEFDDDED